MIFRDGAKIARRHVPNTIMHVFRPSRFPMLWTDTSGGLALLGKFDYETI